MSIGDTHIVAHVAITLGYVAACVLVPRAFGSILRLSWVTFVAGGGFFVACGLTHLGLALEVPDATWVAVNDHLQAGFIVAFVVGLVHDLQRASRRLTAAMTAIGVRHGRDTALEVQATLETALRGAGDAPAPAPRR